MHYLIAYDIADPRRLRRIARIMEKHAMRVQKSVFIMRSTPGSLLHVLELAAAEMDARHDVVQAWKLASNESPEGETRGTTTPVFPAGLVYGGQQPVVIQNRERGKQ